MEERQIQNYTVADINTLSLCMSTSLFINYTLGFALGEPHRRGEFETRPYTPDNRATQEKKGAQSRSPASNP